LTRLRMRPDPNADWLRRRREARPVPQAEPQAVSRCSSVDDVAHPQSGTVWGSLTRMRSTLSSTNQRHTRPVRRSHSTRQHLRLRMRAVVPRGMRASGDKAGDRNRYGISRGAAPAPRDDPTFCGQRTRRTQVTWSNWAVQFPGPVVSGASGSVDRPCGRLVPDPRPRSVRSPHALAGTSCSAPIAGCGRGAMS